MPRPASSPSTAGAAPRFDRSGGEREDEHLLSRVLSEPGTRVLAVRRDAAPLANGGLAFTSVQNLRASASIDTSAASPSGAVPVGSDAEVDALDPLGAPGVQEWAFLGRDGAGEAIVLAALVDDAPDSTVAGAVWAPLRAAGGDLPDVEAELLTTAVALAGWLRDAPFCSACGARTTVRHAGWSRHCPVCGREHFPRTDPAVIVLVTSARSDDRILLGANAAWAGQRFSCFAGFAEAGESLEDAVVREVQEEAGVRLRNVEYRGSQAWPYPRSLMLGFRAEVVDDSDARPDGEEIVDVRWFTRDQVGAALRGEADVQLPGTASIAHRLIDDWYRDVA
ncbi:MULTISPECIES: NAD(+) diphosphatase [Microbacterium]|uniref:NAD(+) diphosphatase n=1 Tax=Microbacterium TaxID=33882 RepID=UPI002787A0D4|nr:MULTISPECIES: NAD(+) diphosphatase [Microbacterium]MDQ1083835.1 NAD+ diphosphatase [Microbacterium sp. SORGH_AS_0344]MDQ1170886.1 NAD+ diphosphatase [Microbacterium proteolyticum]